MGRGGRAACGEGTIALQPGPGPFPHPLRRCCLPSSAGCSGGIRTVAKGHEANIARFVEDLAVPAPCSKWPCVCSAILLHLPP